MKINDPTPLQGATPSGLRRAKQAAAGGADFAALLDAAGAESAAPAGSVEAPALAGTFLGFQEVSDEEIRRQKEFKRGQGMLDSLERLRASLLAGAIPAEVLSELETRLARQREQVADPQLIALMDDIELRVAVELAKLERARLME